MNLFIKIIATLTTADWLRYGTPVEYSYVRTKHCGLILFSAVDSPRSNRRVETLVNSQDRTILHGIKSKLPKFL